MVESNKILTVSYGTFSCTLEGFDDAFDMMKSIAEYFRDLAADDRYFGAEPPTPDPELIARIAARDGHRVEARAQEGGILLRPGLAAAPAAAAPMAQAVAEDVAEEAVQAAPVKSAPAQSAPAQSAPATPVAEAPEAEEEAAEVAVEEIAEVEIPLQDAPVVAESEELEAEAEELEATDLEADVAEDTAEEDSLLSAAIEDALNESTDNLWDDALAHPAEEDTDADEEAVLSYFDDEDDAEEENLLAEAVADTPAAPAMDNSVAAKLQRIRAVVSRQPAEIVDADAFFEDEDAGVEIAEIDIAALHAVEETDFVAEDEAFDEADGTEMAFNAEDEDEDTLVEDAFDAEAYEEVEAEADYEEDVAFAEEAPAPAEEPATGWARVMKVKRSDLEGGPRPAARSLASVVKDDAATPLRTPAAAAPVAAATDEIEETEIEMTATPDTLDMVDEPEAVEVEMVEAPDTFEDAAEIDDASDAIEMSDAAPALELDESFEEEAYEAAYAEDDTYEDEDFDGYDADESSLSSEDEADLRAALRDIHEDSISATAKADDLTAHDTDDLSDEEDDLIAQAEVDAAEHEADAITAEAFDEAEAVSAEEETFEEEAPYVLEPAALAEARVEEDATAEEAFEDESLAEEEAADEVAYEADDETVAEVDVAEEDEAAVEEAAPVSPRRPVLARRARLNEAATEGDMDRILAETNNQLGESEGNRRRSAIAHLRAAVAATRAEKQAGSELGAAPKKTDAYREDLAQVVRPRRARPSGQTPTRRAEDRPAPLKLVAEQRIDTTDVSQMAPVRPRRVTMADLARRVEDDNEAEPRGDVVASAAEAGSFSEFAESMGAVALPDVLEAAASYLSFVEGRDQFSRPQLMTKVRQLEMEGFSREDGLRSFGQLLREGKIRKVKGGRFTVSDRISFRPDQRAAG